jgi:hypothetical protein
MRLWEEYTKILLLVLKGLDESPLLFRWEWISAPLDCPPDETCTRDSMVETMKPLEGLLPPF